MAHLTPYGAICISQNSNIIFSDHTPGHTQNKEISSAWENNFAICDENKNIPNEEKPFSCHFYYKLQDLNNSIYLRPNYSILYLADPNIKTGSQYETEDGTRIELISFKDQGIDTEIKNSIQNFTQLLVPSLIVSNPNISELYWYKKTPTRNGNKLEKIDVPAVLFDVNENGNSHNFNISVFVPGINEFSSLCKDKEIQRAYFNVKTCVENMLLLSLYPAYTAEIHIRHEPSGSEAIRLHENVWLEYVITSDKNANDIILSPDDGVVDIRESLSEGESLFGIMHYSFLIENLHYNAYVNPANQDHCCYVFSGFSNDEKIIEFRVSFFSHNDGIKWLSEALQEAPGVEVNQSDSFTDNWELTISKNKYSSISPRLKAPEFQRKAFSIALINYRGVSSYTQSDKPILTRTIYSSFFKLEEPILRKFSLILPPTLASSSEKDWFRDANRVVNELLEEGIDWRTQKDLFVSRYIAESNFCALSGAAAMNSLVLFDIPPDIMSELVMDNSFVSSHKEMENLASEIKKSFTGIKFDSLFLYPQLPSNHDPAFSKTPGLTVQKFILLEALAVIKFAKQINNVNSEISKIQTSVFVEFGKDISVIMGKFEEYTPEEDIEILLRALKLSKVNEIYKEFKKTNQDETVLIHDKELSWLLNVMVLANRIVKTRIHYFPENPSYKDLIRTLLGREGFKVYNDRISDYLVEHMICGNADQSIASLKKYVLNNNKK